MTRKSAMKRKNTKAKEEEGERQVEVTKRI